MMDLSIHHKKTDKLKASRRAISYSIYVELTYFFFTLGGADEGTFEGGFTG